MPSPSAIRTCQWETVLTHQIMAERKLLQGGDILRSQYGDVKCALGGGWGWRWGDPILEKAQITPALICASSLRREKGRHKYFHPFPCVSPIPPPPVRTRTSEEAERNLVGFERCECPETIKFLLLTGYRNKEIFQVLRAKRVTPERVAQRSADVSNPLSP